jgi:Family of unknown function (DUF5335)
MPGFIEQEKWKSFLDEFTKRNQLRTTRLEVVGEMGAQQEEEYLPLVGVSFEPKGTTAGSVEVALGGETARDKRRVEHLIEKVQRIAPLIGPTGLEEGLALEDQDGTKTLLVFEKLTEIPEKTSEARTEASSRA